jgi:FixJ family two-component response regulator
MSTGDDIRFNGNPVVVIDDDLSVRRGLSRLLRAAGVPVESYDSAEMFLAGRNGHVNPLLIVDVAMAEMSGLDLLERLAAEGRAQPAIVITADQSSATRNRASRLGAPVMYKPIEAENFLAAVGRAIGRDLARRGE